jgi:transposase
MKHKENILRLRAEGKSYREIQEELDCSKGTISYHLGEGQKEKVISRTRSRRHSISKYIAEYKESRGCRDCGGMYPYFVLDLDHREPSQKEFGLAQARTVTKDIERIKKEIEKCDVVCANCHRVRTYARKEK